MGTYLGKNPIGAVVPITYKYLEQVTKEDTSSIDVSDALPFPIRNLQIQGNSIQDGTPTLDAPIEIQSVGDKTKNLWEFDLKEFNVNTKGVIYTFKNPITKNCTFFYRNNNYDATGNIWVISFKTKNGSYTYLYPNHIKQNTIRNITATEENPIISVEVRNGGSGYISAGSIDNLMLVEGTYTADTMPAYEPYGYKIPVKVTGKNLFNPSNWASGTLTMFNDIPCLHIKDTGQTYSYTLDGDSSDVYRLTIKYYRASDSEDKVSNLYSKTRGALITNTKHNTLYTTIVYGGEAIYFTGWSRDMYIDLTITQLEKGKMGADFVPYGKSINIYLKEPLRGINDVVDVLDYKNKKVIRKIGSIIYNATESWSKYDSGNGYMESNTIFIDGKPVVCNMLINSDKLIKTLAMRKNYANVYAYGVQDYYPTQAEWHAFLAENNMEVIGQLVTPTEESIDIETITFEEASDKIVVDTTVEPSNFKIVYLIDADI